MSVLSEELELHGMVFRSMNERVAVDDLNYGITLGWFALEPGPGWVFTPSASFFDVGQLRGLVEFADKYLKLPNESVPLRVDI